VLRLDGRPLQDVTLEIAGHTTRTNGTGRFLLLLEGLPTGELELVIDGRTANRPGRTYGLFETRVKITAGITTALPFTSWSPQLDTANAVTIPSPTTAETVVTTPLIPGLELHMSAGTVIHDHRDNSYARTISITPIPVDRPPFPMPVDAEFPVFFTIQPGGTYIHGYGPNNRGTWLVYPNARGAREGKRVQFFNYDPKGPGWYVYGMGTVKGNQVFPDARTRLYRFTGASFNDGQTPPPAGPPPGDCCGTGGDPVNLTTGIFTFDATDLYIPDVLPIAVTRSYNSQDPEVRPFGRGMTHAYAIFQHSESNFNEADLYLPDGGKIHYARTSPPEVPWYLAEFEHTATPTSFYKSTLKMVGGRFHITLKDGMVYIFGHGAPLQAIRDRHGNEITISWSLVNAFDAGTGNITRITSPNGRWIEFTYYAGTNRVYQAKDNIGRTVTYAYDGNGNLTSVTDPMNYVTTYTYDASNRMTAMKPPNLQGTQLNLVTNEYTTAADAPTPIGWVKKQTHADGGIERFDYTVVNGKSISTDVTDSLGHVRRVSFNSAGYLLEDIRALGEDAEQKTVSGRQAGGNFVTSSSNPLLNQEAIQTYDSLGNVTSVTRIAGTLKAVTTYTYEPLFNQIATITDPLEHTTTYGYDSSGNVISVTDPLDHTTTMTYNGAGQLESVTDALQHTTTYSYQSGELVKVRSHLGFEATRFVDAVGRTVSSTDPLGRITRYEYDLNGRLISTTYAHGGAGRSYTYYPEGQVQTTTDARNNITTYGYDRMGRLASRTDPLLQTESFTYDLDGSLIEQVDRKGQITSRSYDQLRRLSEVQYADGSTVTYTYDNGNRVTTVADSVNIVRGYDDLGRMTSETTSQGAVTYTYDLADRRTTMTITGQPTISYGYDDANRLTSVTQDTRVAVIAYDDADRRSTLTLPNGVVVTYGYDTDSRLTSLHYANGSGTLGNLTYTYDSVGNVIETGGTFARTGLPAALGLATYDSANRLTNQDGVLFSHDANGNLTSDGLGSRFWNARNQLIESTGSIQLSFEYDGIGRRVQKTVAGASKAFLHDGSEVVQELASGLPVAHYMTSLGFDEWFTRIDSAGTTVPLIDQVGSPINLTNSVGGITTQYTYEPFGLSLQTGSGDGNSYRFTGREDDGSGAMYYRARYYDAAAGRFLSEDPMDSDPVNNLYAYVSNNPLTFTDPLGLQSWPTNNTAVPHPFGEPRRGRPNHDGADVRNRLGQPVYSTACGNVIEAGPSAGGGGNQIRILSRDGSVWGYAHTRPTVSVGDCVRECQVIGHSDGSGGVEPHLHLTFRPTRTAPKQDPIERLDRTRTCQGSC
jgi:RHS repeat-associated protein